MGEMQIPEWVDEVRNVMFDQLAVERPTGMRVKDLCRITEGDSFFSEWENRDGDMVIHFFPKSGPDDEWLPGQYILRCRKCDRERRKEDVLGRVKVPCECGHTGLVYIPGRVETKSEVSFPSDMKDILFRAVDAHWFGNVSIEEVVELGAYVIQIPGGWGSNTQRSVDMLESILNGVERSLVRGA